MNRHLTCLFFAWLPRAASAAFALVTQPAVHPGWQAMDDTIQVVKPRRLLVTGDAQALKSTHGNYFTGGSLAVIRPLSRTVEVGLGAGVSYARYHADNGWQLYRLYFLPLGVQFATKLDSRNSFLERRRVSVRGVNAGIEFGPKRHQLTLGYGWLGYAAYQRLIDWRRDAARRINLDYYTRTDLWFMSVMY